jgi:hypothetical protein
MLTYTIKLKSAEALMALRAENEAIMDLESCKTHGDKIYSNAVLNEDSYAFPGSYSISGFMSGLFLPEEIEWVKEN